ncbi:hypothetical protein BH23BAC3_BH23BAC3_07590 [soil metagenome]
MLSLFDLAICEICDIQYTIYLELKSSTSLKGGFD